MQTVAENGYVKIVNTLLNFEADFNAATVIDGGRIALQAVAEAGHLKIVNTLLDSNAGVNAATNTNLNDQALLFAAAPAITNPARPDVEHVIRLAS